MKLNSLNALNDTVCERTTLSSDEQQTSLTLNGKDGIYTDQVE